MPADGFRQGGKGARGAPAGLFASKVRPMRQHVGARRQGRGDAVGCRPMAGVLARSDVLAWERAEKWEKEKMWGRRYMCVLADPREWLGQETRITAAAALLGRSSGIEVRVYASPRTESTDLCWSWSTTTTPSIRPPPLQRPGASQWLRFVC